MWSLFRIDIVSGVHDEISNAVLRCSSEWPTELRDHVESNGHLETRRSNLLTPCWSNPPTEIRRANTSQDRMIMFSSLAVIQPQAFRMIGPLLTIVFQQLNLSIVGELSFSLLDELPFILTITNGNILTDATTPVETVRLRWGGEETDPRILAFVIDQFFGVFIGHVEIGRGEEQSRMHGQMRVEIDVEVSIIVDVEHAHLNQRHYQRLIIGERSRLRVSTLIGFHQRRKTSFHIQTILTVIAWKVLQMTDLQARRGSFTFVRMIFTHEGGRVFVRFDFEWILSHLVDGVNEELAQIWTVVQLQVTILPIDKIRFIQIRSRSNSGSMLSLSPGERWRWRLPTYNQSIIGHVDLHVLHTPRFIDPCWYHFSEESVEQGRVEQIKVHLRWKLFDKWEKHRSWGALLLMVVDTKTPQVIEKNNHAKRRISFQCCSNGIDLLTQRSRMNRFTSLIKGYLPVRIRMDPFRNRAKKCRCVLWPERDLSSTVERNHSARREHRNSMPEEWTRDHSWRSNRIYSNKKKKTKYSSTTNEGQCLVRWPQNAYNKQNEAWWKRESLQMGWILKWRLIREKTKHFKSCTK